MLFTGGTDANRMTISTDPIKLLFIARVQKCFIYKSHTCSRCELVFSQLVARLRINIKEDRFG